MTLTVCAQPGCAELTTNGYCWAHTRKPWATSTRQQHRRGTGWQQQQDAKRILRRDHGICYVCGLKTASQVDHIVNLAAGGTDTDNNKAAICDPCHRAKTAREAQAGRRGGR